MKTLDEILKYANIWDYEDMGIMHMALIKLPDCKTCTVVWSDNEIGWEHVSVSPKHKFTLPSWNDMCILKDIFFGEEEEVYQIHPKKSRYVNIMENCLHLWKPIGHELDELVEGKRNV